MRKHNQGTLSAFELVDERLGLIVEVWNAYRTDDDVGATNRGALDELERQVTECLCQVPPNIDLADQLTAMALHIIAGRDGP